MVMDELDIALDVEGVLSNTHRATADRSDMLTRGQCPPTDWEFETKEHYQEFMHVSQNLWHNHYDEIPPMEPTLEAATHLLSQHHNVDIVTHRSGVKKQMRDWLDSQNIIYNDFYVSSGHKTDTVDADVHIDDSPVVIDDVQRNNRFAFIVAHEYNKGIALSDDIWIVSGVTEAANLLSDPTVVERVRSL
jgi:hypothetical protein